MATAFEAYSTQLNRSCWRIPEWVLPTLQIDPVLLHRGNSPLLLIFNHAVFTRMRTRLPRELRDLIWSHFWDDESFESTSIYMRQMLSGCKKCKLLHDLCSYHTQLPHFLQPDLVDHEMVREVVECWYMVAKAHEKTPHAHDLSEVSQFIHGDSFGVGIDPTQVLRCLHISFRLAELVPPATEVEKCSTKQIKTVAEQQELITKPLLAIKNKRGFKLTISFAQTRIRLNLWQHVIDTFGEPVKAFLNEGGTVEASFEYQYFGEVDRKAVYDFSGALEDPERDWKNEAKTWLDKQNDIEPCHRAYRDEHLPTFNPEDWRYYTEDEYDSEQNIANHDWDETPEEDHSQLPTL
ncbi:hypothetical protein PtrSN002B_005840 [Pyrenophora tritici-repentis]|uniref:Uncharacterized protein n=3 Tax=Pyrenophora tritici-repentis TaxID=45151 RepID=A0A2W1FKR4_9PLEO|nr:uncharacterized protein PTRG_11276 [Pyrenophora tritici-repentis Pt-1C-BFP]KAA8622412.1 hypothetical protein PtrV1_03718 [Pyrenophora tritici-repentis]EDU44326.1 predicted protein [Pyrenophora tritici-repentis Pt-1C-BFP]KAF7451396.1 hypothetical protein A1F99_031730 [Pyrenophora tritici-repentis]KAF7575497.1 hypothetical protein PtrM4_071210 [Pyrenophora tritici-repentis]KAG9385756.1 hypothetical protein A1F94_002506 [Pyrenophora tritici-repentis]